MRTTLELDDRVLAAARAKAAAESISLGRAVSLLALQTLEQTPIRIDGFPMFEPVDEHVITDAMVHEHQDD